MTLQIKKRDLLSQAHAVSESHRTDLDRQINVASGFLDQALNEALLGFPILENASGKRDLIDTVMQIHSSWHSMGRAALNTGKLLLRIYRMDKAIYQALFRAEKSILPFGQSVESKLRRIAEAVEQGRVDEKRLPSAYSAAYEIVTLNDEHLKLADSKGLLRPETQRDDVLMFKHEVRRTKVVEETPRVLRLQRARLVRRLETLMQEVTELNAEITRISQRLSSSGVP